MIKIKKAQFVKSAQNLSQVPPALYPEAVFLGRSNVGKSTLINLLAGKRIAKSSSTPGKTQLINHFEIEFEDKDRILKSYFVDLPGFGYAKVSKTLKDQWEKDLWDFLYRRNAIKLFIQLIDSRHLDLEIDRLVEETLNRLRTGDQKILKIYTKCDKITANKCAALAQGALLMSTDESIFKPNWKGGRQKIIEAVFKGLFDAG